MLLYLILAIYDKDKAIMNEKNIEAVCFDNALNYLKSYQTFLMVHRRLVIVPKISPFSSQTKTVSITRTSFLKRK